MSGMNERRRRSATPPDAPMTDESVQAARGQWACKQQVTSLTDGEAGELLFAGKVVEDYGQYWRLRFGQVELR